MKQGEIWLVRYDPSVGHEFQKDRPAVIISSNQALKYSSLITVLATTSSLAGTLRDDIKIKKDVKNRLYSDSVIKVCHISSFDQERFIKRIGEVDEIILKRVKKYLQKHFAI